MVVWSAWSLAAALVVDMQRLSGNSGCGAKSGTLARIHGSECVERISCCLDRGSAVQAALQVVAEAQYLQVHIWRALTISLREGMAKNLQTWRFGWTGKV
eukprot:3113129-Amphidinium_carterae.1